MTMKWMCDEQKSCSMCWKEMKNRHKMISSFRSIWKCHCVDDSLLLCVRRALMCSTKSANVIKFTRIQKKRRGKILETETNESTMTANDSSKPTNDCWLCNHVSIASQCDDWLWQRPIRHRRIRNGKTFCVEFYSTETVRFIFCRCAFLYRSLAHSTINRKKNRTSKCKDDERRARRLIGMSGLIKRIFSWTLTCVCFLAHRQLSILF